MPPNQGFDFSKGPQKIWIDSFSIRVIDGIAHMSFASGTELYTFVANLNLAKKLARGLGNQVDEIEKKTGVTFDDRLDNDPLPSPLSDEMKPKA